MRNQVVVAPTLFLAATHTHTHSAKWTSRFRAYGLAASSRQPIGILWKLSVKKMQEIERERTREIEMETEREM